MKYSPKSLLTAIVILAATMVIVQTYLSSVEQRVPKRRVGAVFVVCTYSVRSDVELAAANNQVRGGETICLSEGTYNVTIRPVGNGESESKRIVYQNNSGKKVTVTKMIDLSGKAYVTVSGIDVLANGSNKKYANLNGAHHIIIEDSTMTSTVTDNPTNPPVNMNNTSYSVIRNSFLKGSNAIYNDLIQMMGNSHHNLIENNRLEQGSHTNLLMSGSQDRNNPPRYNIIRNNHFINDYHHCVNMMYGSYMNVFEGNVFERCGNGKEDGSPIDSSSSGDFHMWGNDNVIRNNVVMNSGKNDPDIESAITGVSSTYILDKYPNGEGLATVVNNRFYHNIIYGNYGRAIDLGIYHRSLYTGNEYRDNKFVNNILYGNNTGIRETVQIQYNHYGSPRPADVQGDEWRNNLIGEAGQKVIVWRGQPLSLEEASVRSNPVFRENVSGDPQFVRPDRSTPSTADFHLLPASKAIDGGDFLTKATAPAGTGTVVSVADAKFFIDGWGISSGDAIEIGTNGKDGSLRVTAVDYGTNKITVNRSITWSAGDGVSLPYSGSRPDIGAFEFGGTGVQPTPTPTPTRTQTPPPSATRTPTRTPTSTPTRSSTSTRTPTSTQTSTPTQSRTPTLPPASITPVILHGDINGDRIVNGLDYVLLFESFARRTGDALYNPKADIAPAGGDSIVNALDYVVLFENFGRMK